MITMSLTDITGLLICESVELLCLGHSQVNVFEISLMDLVKICHVLIFLWYVNKPKPSSWCSVLWIEFKLSLSFLL